MGKKINLTHQTRDVLAAFLAAPAERQSGAEIAKATGLASGSLYPILIRLEEAGWLTSAWEAEEPSDLGRPRRRLYQITAEGMRNSQRIAFELAPNLGGLSWT